LKRGARVLTASGDDLTVTDDPFKVAMRQIAAVFAQLEKARLVGKLIGGARPYVPSRARASAKCSSFGSRMCAAKGPHKQRFFSVRRGSQH
jgi:hypothetical protein